MTEIHQRTVLFADLRGSTALYESLGNAAATEVVTRNVAVLAHIVAEHGGLVVKTLGDGLMAMFNTPAEGVRAAAAMHASLDNLEPTPRHMPALKLQVALAHGEVVEMAGDCFGDAVNVAARLLDHTGDNETLATSVVLEQLDESASERFRSLDRMQLRGRAEPVHVYLLEAHRSGNTATTAFGGLNDVVIEPEAVRLTWLDLTKVFSGPSLPIVLGRSPQATFCVDDGRVSRSHARIDWHGGAFQLTDLSYNGTYVRFGQGGETVALRRSTCTLHGKGTIVLGAPPDDIFSPCVSFEIVQFSDSPTADAVG
jgi:class 3 adenylate cyclase